MDLFCSVPFFVCLFCFLAVLSIYHFSFLIVRKLRALALNLAKCSLDSTTLIYIFRKHKTNMF